MGEVRGGRCSHAFGRKLNGVAACDRHKLSDAGRVLFGENFGCVLKDAKEPECLCVSGPGNNAWRKTDDDDDDHDRVDVDDGDESS